jgi:type IV fimbrial biogenesis protein FimT
MRRANPLHRGLSRAASKAAGVTIIELLVTLAVAAVLIALATPMFSDFVRKMRLRTSLGDMSADLALARSESIRRNSRVLVCPRASAASTACAAVVSSTTWMNGWLVCYDTDANGACDTGTSTNPNPVRVRAAPASPLSLAGPASTVIFFPVGSANGAATFTMTIAGSSSWRSVSVAPSGSLTSSSH